MRSLAVSSSWIRPCGLAGTLGGTLWALWYVGVYFVGERYETYEAYNRLMPVVLLLLLAGLAGAHAAQGRAHGRSGRTGFVLASVGLVAMIAGNAAEFWLFTTQPYAEANGRQASWALFLVGMLLLAVGSVLFGVATARASILPRLGALLLVVWLPAGILCAVLLGATGLLPGDLAFSLGSAAILGTGWIVLGLALWSGRGEPARRPACER